MLIGIAGETYFRMVGRFGNVISDLSTDSAYWRFEPGVGLLRPPHMELTLSNSMDSWTVQRANSLGFLDREPIDPTRAEESCHISIIGDSFVEAKEVSLSDKLQVRLEELAAREAPHLDVTTSAFGIQRTGQVNQLPFYDRYARRMSPDMVVLVFVGNDRLGNSTEPYALRPGYVPERLPYGQAALDEDGNIRWFPPAIDFSDAVFAQASESRNLWHRRAIYRAADASYFMRWLGIKTKLISANDWVYRWFRPSQDSVTRYQEWMYLVGGDATTESDFNYMESWVFTRFALEQFKRRADRDGATLMVLAIHHVSGEGNPIFERLSATAESMGIPIVSQHDYIVGQGGRVDDADWEIDGHWTPAGHQWAAEAIWEHIKDEWHGQCPQVEPQQDVEVKWTHLNDPPDEDGRDYTLHLLDEPLPLPYKFHTPDGEAWVQIFPASDLERYRSVHESVKSRRPAAHSEWDVHIYDDGLTYLKESCSADDRNFRFFLHVFPEDESDLPRDSQSSEFENLVFYSEFRGVEFDGICMVSIDLPEYDISSIRTGQVVDDAEAWSVYYNFALLGIMDAVNELRQSEREPAIRSSFNVYLDDSRLLYAKSPCAANDRTLPFFLHVFPADGNNLLADSGFDNLDFKLIDRGGVHDVGCFAAVGLPGYEIASISTGQFAGGVEIWRARYNFALPSIIDAVLELQRSGREPEIRSNFHVYIDDGQLIYVKDSCSIDDRDTPFFLHVIPADEKDLPAGRGESGFDNLGFELMQRGGESDGKCFAAVDLPEYDIASIKTGQVTDGAETWSVRYNFALPDILDAVRELQQSGREPEIRSNFHVYIDDGQLIYVKDSCDADDRDTPFFLHVFPTDQNDLPDGREESSFDNLGFELMQKGGVQDGGCFAAVDLPEYEIESIRTGQFSEDVQTWRADYNFALAEIIDAVQEIRQSGRDPDIRSAFNVYINDGWLIYVKDSCTADDRDLPFFLHVSPADDKDLSAGREESGFNNLDFELTRKGGESDGLCFAAVDLPKYSIASIRTGQWVRGEGSIWEASIDFAE